jgi:predicted LPLAT superfamily acyltransferase
MARKPDNPLTRAVAAPAAWVTRRERGSFTMLRIMTFLSVHLGRSVGRCILYIVAAYFFAFAPTARRDARNYLRRALGREPRAIDRFRQVLSFASVIHDRIFLVNDRFDLFDISIEGESLVRGALSAGNGAFLMGAHLGSFEVTRAIGRRQPSLRLVLAMYEENARELNAMFAAINPSAKPEIIGLGHMEAMLKMRECLERGAFVGLLGDRSLRDESGQAVNFLGERAHFPTGAMRVAAILHRPVIFMAGLYRGKNRYHVVFEPLADFSTTPAGQRQAAVQGAIERYVALLEKYCRSDPYNWFNFHDFWRAADKTLLDAPS